MSRYRLDPTPEQEDALLRMCGHARFVWNLGLEQRSHWRPGRAPAPGFAEQSRQLTEARAAHPWLAEGSATVQHQALRDLDQAFTNFFKGTHGYPKWRRAGRHEGFRIIGDSRTWRVETLNRHWSRLLVPKVGWIRFRRSRAVPDAKSYRITRDRSGRWHVAFAVIPDPVAAPGTGETVGVDRGVAVSAALSTGDLLHCPGLRPKEAERLLRLQRSLSRSKKGSKGRATLLGKIAKVRAREVSRRKDWVEKTSTDLARRFDVIGIEDLHIQRMTRSARGTLAEPGTNVRQKAGLNREIRKNGWGLLGERLEHKALGRVVKINPAWTSQTCSACGHVDGKSRENQADFKCTACGSVMHADVNAACNIRDLAVAGFCITNSTAAGRVVAGRRDRSLGQSTKRQPKRLRLQQGSESAKNQAEDVNGMCRTGKTVPLA